MKYPRVLIIGEYFNLRSGGGITLTNLFCGWDKNNIAVASREINNPDFSVCNKVYQLGYLENKRRFPFNLSPWGGKTGSQEVFENTKPQIVSINKKTKKSDFKSLYVDFLKWTNLINYKQELIISNGLRQWISEFSPDIIYSQLSSLELIRFVNSLHIELNIPLALHIMDDWPLAVKKRGLMKYYWYKVIDQEFRMLLSKASIRLSISESMSEQYKSRYGYNFIPFHNPIDVQYWSKNSKKNYQSGSPFIMLYAGRIGTGIQDCFLDIASATKILVDKGMNIEFHIQPTTNNPVLEKVAKFSFVKIRSIGNYKDLPSVLSEADLLVLPGDFDKKAISFLKYSMPTKVSEYMITGTPILLYSSNEIAVTQHALKYKWAYVVSEQNEDKLANAIFDIYSNMKLRKNLGEDAKIYAKNNFDSNIIRNHFRTILLNN